MSSNRRVVSLGFAVSMSLASSVAVAHLDLQYPPMRAGNQKSGPCEAVPWNADVPVTTLLPGSQLTIDITETIGHPGHYRIMFDADLTDGEDFPDPTACDDVGVPDGITLLGDKLLPAQGGTCPGFHTPGERNVQSNVAYSFDVTLPDIECENCGIQVIQVMTDASKADANGNWVATGGRGLYFRCANIRLSNNADPNPDPNPNPDPTPDPDPNPDPGPGGGTGPVGGGCSSSNGQTSTLFALLIVGVFAVARRRRSAHA